jgi:hypothetical protein
MKNPYDQALNVFFDRIASLRYNAFRLNNQLAASLNNHEGSDEDAFISGSALIISDITGPTDNGYTINFHTGHSKFTLAKGYKEEVAKLISIECCYSFAQAFEALEGFIKDVVHLKADIDPDFFELISHDKLPYNNRKVYPGGEKLLKLLKASIKDEFGHFSRNNNYNLRFTEFLCTISDVRHAVIHSRSVVEKKLVFKSDIYRDIFNHFFSYKECDIDKIEVRLDLDSFNKLTKSISEFAFQAYKMLSVKDNYPWFKRPEA